jgi:hypothetical protein
MDTNRHANDFRSGRNIGSENLLDPHFSVPLKISAIAIAICLIFYYLHFQRRPYPVSA